MIINDDFENAIDLIYFLDNKIELIKNDKSDNSTNKNDSILNILNNYSIIIAEVKKSSD